MSQILYGATLWIGAPNYLKKKVQTIQLEACRMAIGHKAARWSTKKLLETMGWVSIQKNLERASATTSHAIIHQNTPAQLAYRIREKYNTNNSIQTRMTGPYKLGPKPKMVGRTRITKYHYRANSYEVYAKIPEEIINIKTPFLFKKWLKRYQINPKKLPSSHKLKPR